MRSKVILAVLLCLGVAGNCQNQASPYTNSVFRAQTFTATGQTGAAIQLNSLTVPSTVGSSFASGTITVTGTSLTTVTLAVQGSSDNGVTFFPLPISVVASPSTPPTTTVTATVNGQYQVNLAGMTHVRFVTSGTFTATNVSITLTGSPNALVSRGGTSSGGGATTPATAQVLKGCSAVNCVAVAAPGTDYVVPSGNTATATALAATPTGCDAGQASNTFDAQGNATGCAPIGGVPHTPAKSIQIANSGGTAVDSDPNILIDPTIHQHQIVGAGSQAIGVVNPVTGYAQTSNNSYTDSRVNSPNDFPRTTYFGGGGGFNYGNGPGVTRNWTTGGLNFWNVNFGRRGITQYLSGGINCRKVGDCAGFYMNQVYTVGGLTGASDEGGVGDKRNGGELAEVYQGTATAGAATGSTTLPISAGNTCDGCFMYDLSKPGPSGHFTGLPAFVALTANAGYWAEPIDTPVTPSTAYGIPICTMPQLTDQTVPQTVSCTITGALGSTGVYVSGIASLSGPYAEQVRIVASNPSGGSQAVAITYTNPHVSGHSILWQGGTAQGQLQTSPNDQAISTVPNGQTVFGAPDSTHLAAGVAFAGFEATPIDNWTRTVGLGVITKSGSTATAVFGDSTVAFTQFANLASAIISSAAGCTGGTMNGTVTAVTVNFLALSVSWTDASSSTGCTSAQISVPSSVYAYQLYPYAEQIAAGDINTQATLEPNKVPWASGDSLVQPHPPTFGYNGIWHGIQAFNMHGRAQSTGIFQTFAGAGIGGFQNFLRLSNLNPCSMYAGCGGQLTLNPWIQLEGPNYGTIRSNIPIDPTVPIMQFNCPAGYNSTPGAAGVCTDREVVLNLPLGAMTLDGFNGWTFTGAGISATAGTFGPLSASGGGFTVASNTVKIRTPLSSGSVALELQGQFNNGGAMADLRWFDYQDSVETGRIRSSYYFGNLTSIGLFTGSFNPFLAKTNGSGGVDVTLSTPNGTTTISNLASPNIAPVGGTNGTISFGANFGASAINLFDGGAGSRVGWGLRPSEMQFFIGTGNHYSWNGGGDFQTSGTNELMRLMQATGALLVGTTTDNGVDKLQVNGSISATATVINPIVSKSSSTVAACTDALNTSSASEWAFCVAGSGGLVASNGTAPAGAVAIYDKTNNIISEYSTDTARVVLVPTTFFGGGPHSIQMGVNLFSDLVTCNSGAEGTQAPVTDSTTNTWGATITGSGTFHVLAYCDGTAWTVGAK